MACLDIVIAYGSGIVTQIVQDLLGGRLDVMIETGTIAFAQIRGGLLRGLAVIGIVTDEPGLTYALPALGEELCSKSAGGLGAAALIAMSVPALAQDTEASPAPPVVAAEAPAHSRCPGAS